MLLSLHTFVACSIRKRTQSSLAWANEHSALSPKMYTATTRDDGWNTATHRYIIHLSKVHYLRFAHLLMTFKWRKRNRVHTFSLIHLFYQSYIHWQRRTTSNMHIHTWMSHQYANRNVHSGLYKHSHKYRPLWAREKCHLLCLTLVEFDRIRECILRALSAMLASNELPRIHSSKTHSLMWERTQTDVVRTFFHFNKTWKHHPIDGFEFCSDWEKILCEKHRVKRTLFGSVEINKSMFRKKEFHGETNSLHLNF